MPKKASKAKKVAPPVVDDTDAKKPPKLEEARDSVHLAAFCWTMFLDPSEPVMSHEKVLELFQEHVKILHDIEYYWLQLRYSEQYTGPISDGPFRPYDQVLDMPTGCNGLSAIELFRQIDFAISTPPSEKKISRDAIIEKVASLGLPAKLFEARAISSKIENELRYAPDARKNYPGLKNLFEQMHKQGLKPPTKRQIAQAYLKDRGHDTSLTLDKIMVHIKNNSGHGDWTGPKNPSKKPPG
jgi:hypothetical protein